MKNVDFIIKAPKWQLYLFAILTAICFIALFVLFVLCYFNVIDKNLLTFAILPGFILILSLIGLYVVLIEQFSLIDGCFLYRKPFKKSQYASISDVNRIELKKATPALIKVVFYNFENQKLICFLDDGTAFKSGEFEKALKKYNIPIGTVLKEYN